MDHRNVLVGELTRKELGEAISSGTVKGAIVPLGSCEQHQDHLAIIHDTVSVTEIAKRVAGGSGNVGFENRTSDEADWW